MRKIILNVAVSLDGFIEGSKGEFDWCFTDQDYGMSEFMSSIDTILFGRKSYEVLKSFDKNPYPGYSKVLVSKTLADEISETEIINGDFIERIKAMKSEEGKKDIWLFGGSQLFEALWNHQLVDEIQLAVHPLVLGGGKSLFPADFQRRNLLLRNQKTYSSGLVQLFYATVQN